MRKVGWFTAVGVGQEEAGCLVLCVCSWSIVAPRWGHGAQSRCSPGLPLEPERQEDARKPEGKREGKRDAYSAGLIE